jgi:putative Mn2+ efflux pump MntP
VFKLLAFMFPLGLNTFAIAAAVGAAAKPAIGDRLRISLLFTLFQSGMPLIGVTLGVRLAHAIGDVADDLAAAAVIAAGAWMLLGAGGQKEEQRTARLAGSHGLSLFALAFTISLDELAVGFSVGLAHLPLTAVIVAIAVQAFVATQIGAQLGARVSEHVRKGAERLAAVALIGLGLVMMVARTLT